MKQQAVSAGACGTARRGRLAVKIAAAVAAAVAGTTVACAAQGKSAAAPPVYVHMNGANMFLENVVVVRPGQPVVFVDEDTGDHTIIGYSPVTGKTSTRFNGVVQGTPGPGHPVHTYTISFSRPGLRFYYCSVHAELKHEPGGRTVPIKRPTVGGFGDPMSGLIIVTRSAALLNENPPTSAQRILPNYFGG